jgi:hypothetical protein
MLDRIRAMWPGPIPLGHLLGCQSGPCKAVPARDPPSYPINWRPPADGGVALITRTRSSAFHLTTRRLTSCCTGLSSDFDVRRANTQRWLPPRRPEDTLLQTLVSEHWPRFHERAEAHGGSPKFEEEEFDAYLRCGILEHGLVQLACRGCSFSCKRRGFCPSAVRREVRGTHRCRRSRAGRWRSVFGRRDPSRSRRTHRSDPFRPRSAEALRARCRASLVRPSAGPADLRTESWASAQSRTSSRAGLRRSCRRRVNVEA